MEYIDFVYVHDHKHQNSNFDNSKLIVSRFVLFHSQYYTSLSVYRSISFLLFPGMEKQLQQHESVAII